MKLNESATIPQSSASLQFTAGDGEIKHDLVRRSAAATCPRRRFYRRGRILSINTDKTGVTMKIQVSQKWLHFTRNFTYTVKR